MTKYGQRPDPLDVDPLGRAMRAIATQIACEAEDTLNDAATAGAAERMDATRVPETALMTLLGKWARAAETPLVLLIDDVDALVGDSFVSVLRQLRSGFINRPARFPQSVVLCGLHDVRDYGIRAGPEGKSSRVAGSSTSRPERFG